MRKRMMAGFAMLLCVAILWVGGTGRVTAAESGQTVNTFSGSVGLLKKENDNYVMQVTVENAGEDFSGTVQVIFAGIAYENCAYSTEITLPAQGKKQFTITVTERAADTVRGMCALNFLDKKGHILQSIQLKNVFGDTMKGISVGILSDRYSDLTYLDAGGNDFSIRGTITYPLSLIELNNDNLKEYLDGLYFLIIDRFNVESLGEENILAIQEWVKGGGWMIVGTGEYAQQTLSGFSEDFLDLNIKEISQPGEENNVSWDALNYGYYYYYNDVEVDFTRMATASLESDTYHAYDISSQNPAILYSIGDGAVAVYYISLGEPEMQKLEYYMIHQIYDEVMYTSDSYRTISYSSDMEYMGQRTLSFLDSRQTNVDFTWLKVLIGVYVAMAGPIFYLILRKCRKSEWYWLGVPALGLIFIVGVFFFGRNARVSEPRAYSVTIQQADGSRKDAYFLAYHAGVKPWEVRLNDSFDVAGPGWNGHYYWNYSSNVSDYLYTVKYGGDGLWTGIKPEENFQSGYFYAGGRTESKGQLTGAGFDGNGGVMKGTIANETVCDLDYLAVVRDSYIMVFSDVKAGERFDIQQAAGSGRCVYQNSFNYYGDLANSMVYNYWTRQNSLPYDQTTMGALFIGMGTAFDMNQQESGKALIIGVMKDYDKIVAEKCDEISYGCLYSFVDAQ